MAAGAAMYQQQQHQQLTLADSSMTQTTKSENGHCDTNGSHRPQQVATQQQQHHHHHHQEQQVFQQHQYPPNHPLGNSKHLCSICGDRATGKHYGVFSCEGCKGFFKRTIRKDIVYVCRAQGNCLIDMRQRNRCQYCRYQKCLSRGMKREAVQEEKQRLKLRAQQQAHLQVVPSSSQTPSLNQDQQQYHCDATESEQSNNSITRQQQQQQNHMRTTMYSHQQFQQQQHQEFDHHHNQSVSPISSSSATNVLTTTNSHPQFLNPYQDYHHSYNNKSYNDFNNNNMSNNNTNSPLRSSSSSSTNVTFARFSPSTTSVIGQHRIDELTLKWAAQVQIEQLIDWAKSVPKFTELLIDDQITLLRAYWNELIIADLAFRSVEAIREGLLQLPTSNKSPSPTSQTQAPNVGLCIGRGLFLAEHQAHEIGLGTMFERIHNELVLKMHDMQVDTNELNCLRAIILFNPETHGLKTSQPIEEYRGNIYTTLEAYCRKYYDEQPNRFGKLLLRLPALRSIGLKCDSMRQLENNNSYGSTNGNNRRSYLDHRHHHHQAASISSSPPNSNGSSSNCSTSSSLSSISSNQNSGNNTATSTTGSQNNSGKLGYQVKLLFFDVCYESSTIDTFLRSSLSL